MIEFYDSCLIRRSAGDTDDEGNEIFTDLYSGECLLQLDGNSRYNGYYFEHEPILFIPVNNVMLEVNDFIEVTTFNGRKLNYLVKNWEAIKDDEFEELNDTCIWLKDGADV